MGVCSIKQKSLALLIALIMVLGICPLSAFAAEGDSSDEEYKYVYAGLTWAEYWESEGVYLSGDDLTASSDEEDSRGELDKGAFDTVSRATANHGLHRGSYQCSAVIYDKEGNSYAVSHWSDDGKTLYLTDGTSVGFSRGTITKADGTTVEMENYKVTGIKYVPVKVKSSDYDAFKAAYAVVENGETLSGGYGEQQLSAYTKTAAVTANTNGLKEAAKNADGTFSFSKRQNGTDSGLKGEVQKVSNIEVTVKPGDGAYGEFLRVDFLKDYGDLGAMMQTVRWDYYGDDDTYTDVKASYGTKFAADNWMHKSNGIQLGLTDSLRCQLPEGRDGTGYWTVTVYALGYADYTVSFQATEDNIVKPAEEMDTARLKAAVNKAKSLKEDDYTAASWTNLQTELAEAEEELAAPHTQAVIDEATEHLEAAIKALVKVTKPPAAPAATIKLDKSKATIYTKTKKSVTLKATVTGENNKVTWKSSKSSVATVNSKGVVIARKEGTTVITATANGKSAKCTITVKKPTLKLTKSSATIKKGKTVTIKAKTTPTAKITYKSSNKKVATVTSKGVVKGKKKGTAKITVTANGIKKTFKVNVK